MEANEGLKPVDILLVEDNAGDADLAKEVLEDSKMKNELFWVDDGEKAMSFLLKQGAYKDMPRPDLILLDLNLPRKDGREILEEIKNHPELKFIPVVVLTTSRAEEDILKSYNLHANCYIAKPINLDQFVQVVKAIENFWMSIVLLPENKH